MSRRIHLYDTTLRDGAQTQGVDFTLGDKLAIATLLDELGIDTIEGGWPGANPVDTAFFQDPPAFRHARLAAFGMTRRSGRSAANDPGLTSVIRSGAPVVTLVGKTWGRQAEQALGVDLAENRAMIADSLAEAARYAHEVIFDAEHFFDGFKADPAYALACLEAAAETGARWLVLCDTNGGTLPDEIRAIVAEVASRIDPSRLGIHTHNDTETAVAGTLAALSAGVCHVQGTLNGLGERCGNANLVSLIPTLVLKTDYWTAVSKEALTRLTPVARAFDDQLNRQPNSGAAYVGANAFAHKGGLHASAVAKDPSFYEHVDPEAVGNQRTIVVSDQAGRANLAARLKGFPDLALDDRQIGDLLGALKERESQGYAYEGAAASFELLARRQQGQVPDYFRLDRFRVIDERRFNAKGALVTLSEATVTIDIAGRPAMTVAEGNGPVNALDLAIRQALLPTYPALAGMRLVDYRVRILTPEAGTAAVTRVLIESADTSGHHWSTVGVSGNIIDASYAALHDAIAYRLFRTGAGTARAAE
ncbi:citramalate synthase [Marinivivus vitaminiproducens]|uniref:citramalate synthase n=1 Tax=Marinivivus vitaminiproducens TaxID=3035935 RepID=UPI0027988185|nr:citramalate synthase [Geminicoccaceae bacterium SCSIO 64248]